MADLRFLPYLVDRDTGLMDSRCMACGYRIAARSEGELYFAALAHRDYVRTQLDDREDVHFEDARVEALLRA